MKLPITNYWSALAVQPGSLRVAGLPDEEDANVSVSIRRIACSMLVSRRSMSWRRAFGMFRGW